MKNYRKIVLILFMLVVLIYVTNITSVPNNIVLFKGEKLELDALFGLYLDSTINETIQTGASINKNNVVEKTKISLKLFNFIKVKDIDVNVIPKTSVIPLGNSVRIKTLYKWSFSGWTNRNSRRKAI